MAYYYQFLTALAQAEFFLSEIYDVCGLLSDTYQKGVQQISFFFCIS